MKEKNKTKLFYAISTILLLCMITVGYFATEYMGKKIEADERANLLLRAQTVAALINTQEVGRLQGVSEEISKPEYISVKESLERVHIVNTDTRFVYILGLKDDSMYFIADAEPSTSKDFSAPGDLYADATDEDIQNYSERVAYTKGPYTDAWGNWFSAYAPIISSDGRMLGQMVMDIHSEKLLLRISIVRQATMVVFSLLFLSLLVLLVLIRDSFIKNKVA